MTVVLAPPHPSARRRAPALVLAVLAVVVLVVAVLVAAATPAQAAPSLSASKTADLDPAGETITVTGRGYDESKGIYVALCVDNGPGQAPSPCLGGIDMSGETGSSAWISSNPPDYGEGLATPYGPGGSFTVTLRVKQRDEFTDCSQVSCAIFTRNDHTRSGDRSQDVRLPVTFATPAGGGTPSPSPSPTSSAPASPSPSPSPTPSAAPTSPSPTPTTPSPTGDAAPPAPDGTSTDDRATSADASDDEQDGSADPDGSVDDADAAEVDAADAADAADLDDLDASVDDPDASVDDDAPEDAEEEAASLRALDDTVEVSDPRRGGRLAATGGIVLAAGLAVAGGWWWQRRGRAS